MTKPAREIALRAEVQHRHDAEALLQIPGDAVLVRRGQPRSLLIACPDGCGETLAVNLDPRAGPAWRMYGRNSAISLSPSVWRQGGCESHFIVWRGRIVWCGRFEEDNQEPVYDAGLEAQVLAAMDPVRFRSSHELADQLNEIPWDVSRVARNLVARGIAEEESAQRDSYRRVARSTSAQTPSPSGFWARLWRLLFGSK
jgi:uncharacterized protein DUF6527